MSSAIVAAIGSVDGTSVDFRVIVAVIFVHTCVVIRHFINPVLFTRDSVYAIVRPSVCLSVRRVDHTKTVEVRIMKFSPYGSPITLVFAG